MLQTLRNKKGVTLVELLAVVVILGIIAAIAVPTIGGLIARQRDNAAKQTYQTIVQQARLYAVEESTGTFTLDDLLDSEFVSLTDYEVLGVAANATHIQIVVSGNTVTISILAPATGLVLNGVEMELSGNNFTGNPKP
jgi:type IV pilus assembly protein PilA